ncbi:MAG: type II toxin-antitoxin system VapC family toxin [Chloroflexi bacterium]|nr:type II toxin-antitoxin system VapC family toxin [Chloroflexota bacterium]
MAELLLDTDVFVDHLRGARRLTLGDEQVAYSVVTRCELFAGRQGEESRVAELLEPFVEIPMDRGVAEMAGRFRWRHRVRIADALIGATALQHGLTLVTRNVRDFEAIPNLRVRLPVPNASDWNGS